MEGEEEPPRKGGKEANGQAAFLWRAKSLYYARESALFSADASRVAKKRIADAVKRETAREEEGQGNGGRKEMQKECRSRFHSPDGTSRVLIGTGGGLKNEHAR